MCFFDGKHPNSKYPLLSWLPSLTLCGPENPEWVLCQSVKTQVKCHMMLKPTSNCFYWPFQGCASFVDSFCYLCLNICLCYAVLSATCSLMITCCERADLLALLCVLFSCVTFPNGGPGQMWYLSVAIPDFFFFIIIRVFTVC